MNRGGGFIRSTMGIAFEQLREALLVKIANRAFPVWLDPFGMLGPQIVVNLELKQRK